MPVLLDDEILIPPSMRRHRRYYTDTSSYDDPRVETTIIESPSMGSTIDLPPHRPLTPPRSPIVIHEDHYVPLPTEIECSRGREYVIQPAGRSAVHHNTAGRGGFSGELDMDYSRGNGFEHSRRRYRARSVGPLSDYEGYSDDYYIDDDTHHGIRHHRHGSPHRHHGHHHGHHGHRAKHLLE